MNYMPLCAVCGCSVDPSMEHSRVEVENVRHDDRNEKKEFFLHQRCEMNTLGSWETP